MIVIHQGGWLTCRVPFWNGVGDSQELSLNTDASPAAPNCAPLGNVSGGDEKDII